MSFVSTAPDVLGAAARELASIRSSLGQATAAATTPLTGLVPAAADEVSAAISQLFGSYGQDFQALSAQASAFHDEFVNLLNGTAAAYLGSEIDNARLAGSGGAATTVADSGGTTTPPNPWVALFDNTGANLDAIGAQWALRPYPLLRQILANQGNYAQLVSAAVGTGLQDFPAELQVWPAQIERATQTAQGFNPVAFAQWFGANQGIYGQTLNTALANAGQDFNTTIPVFESDLGMADQDIGTGNFHGAVQYVAHSVLDLFISGFDTSHLSIHLLNPSELVSGPIYVEGPAGALLPILSIPGQELQLFADIMPAGSTAQHMAQNLTNAVDALTNASITTSVGVTPSGLTFDAYFGLPLQLGFGILGPPITTLDATATVLSYLGYDVQTGDGLAFAGAVLDSPAIIANGLLNGQTTVDLALPVTALGLSIPAVMHLPFDGLLTPPQTATVTLPTDPALGIYSPYTLPLGGTEFGGLIPALVITVPEALAAAITPSSS
ncbi:MAG: PE family protein [Mycobacterium sp.]|uniref:PE family protein n=1 Tax=Mycobacterium sp. TaxID=1785 RepID=UPI001ECE5BB3|nr:PE domain-containing protein [Mycobacterium sp.]MBW0018932.1 PE family protein [Mycobacterium sp.]